MTPDSPGARVQRPNIPTVQAYSTIATTGIHGRLINPPQTLFRDPTYGQKATPWGKRGEIA